MSTPINLIYPLELNGQPAYPLTTAQQVIMPDGKRLDKALEEGKYTLVHEVTTTEAVSSLAYECDAQKVYIVVDAPKNTDSADCVGVIKFNNYAPFLYFPKMTVSATPRLTRAKASIINEMLSVYDYSSIENSNPTGVSSVDWGDAHKYKLANGYFTDKISLIEAVLTSGKTFPIGTTFKVYEVK